LKYPIFNFLFFSNGIVERTENIRGIVDALGGSAIEES
jgi:hypothetical protein